MPGKKDHRKGHKVVERSNIFHELIPVLYMDLLFKIERKQDMNHQTHVVSHVLPLSPAGGN